MNGNFLNRMNAFILLCEKTTGKVDSIENIFNEVEIKNSKSSFELVIFLDYFEVVPKTNDNVITLFVVLKKFREKLTYGDIVFSFSIKLSEEKEASYTDRFPMSVELPITLFSEEGKYAFSVYRIDSKEDTSTKDIQQVLDEGEMIGETRFNVIK